MNLNSFSQIVCILSFSVRNKINQVRPIKKLSPPINPTYKVKREYTIRSCLKIHTCPHCPPFGDYALPCHVHYRACTYETFIHCLGWECHSSKAGEGMSFGLSVVSPATRGQCRGRLCHWLPIRRKQCSRLQRSGGGCFSKPKGDPTWLSLILAIFKIAHFFAGQTLSSKSAVYRPNHHHVQPKDNRYDLTE